MDNDTPIRLVSQIKGLSLLVKKGSTTVIPGTTREQMTHGSWLNFERGLCVISPTKIARLWGSREEAENWIRQHPRFGRDFNIAPNPPGKKRPSPKEGAAATGTALGADDPAKQ